MYAMLERFWWSTCPSMVKMVTIEGIELSIM